MFRYVCSLVTRHFIRRGGDGLFTRKRQWSRLSYLPLFKATMSTEMQGSHLLEKNLLLEEFAIIISTNLPSNY